MPRLLHVFTVPDSLVFLDGQVPFMQRAGFDVHVVTSPGDGLRRFADAVGVAAHPIEMPRRVTPAGDVAALSRLAALIRSLKPDLVHAHTPKGGLLGCLAAAATRVRGRIYHMRGLPLETARGPMRAVLTTTERVAARAAHRVLCVSPSLRRRALELRLTTPEKALVLGGGSGNGVDARGRFDPMRLSPETRASVRAELGLPDGAPVLGFVGRLVRDKGVVELHEAWSAVRSAFPEAHILMVGAREARDAVPPAVLDAFEADGRVHCVGQRSDVERMYAAMDVLVHPSHREGLPGVLLEAASMSLPIVTTSATGCVDAVQDGVTGLRVPPRDAAALARAISRYLEEPGLRAAHGAAGRAWMLRDFARERIWEALLLEYRRLLG